MELEADGVGGEGATGDEVKNSPTFELRVSYKGLSGISCAAGG
jgi:hypothetical protein